MCSCPLRSLIYYLQCSTINFKYIRLLQICPVSRTNLSSWYNTVPYNLTDLSLWYYNIPYTLSHLSVWYILIPCMLQLIKMVHNSTLQVNILVLYGKLHAWQTTSCTSLKEWKGTNIVLCCITIMNAIPY